MRPIGGLDADPAIYAESSLDKETSRMAGYKHPIIRIQTDKSSGNLNDGLYYIETNCIKNIFIFLIMHKNAVNDRSS